MCIQYIITIEEGQAQPTCPILCERYAISYGIIGMIEKFRVEPIVVRHTFTQISLQWRHPTAGLYDSLICNCTA